MKPWTLPEAELFKIPASIQLLPHQRAEAVELLKALLKEAISDRDFGDRGANDREGANER
jgi:hypothetical protein